MKHYFIINPVAGGKDRTEEISCTVKEAMKSAAPNDAFEIYVTKGPMDASRAVKEKASGGEELRIYACGGDGTLNECVNGAAGFENAAVTHYPTGTGNDFIKIFNFFPIHRNYFVSIAKTHLFSSFTNGNPVFYVFCRKILIAPDKQNSRIKNDGKNQIK